MPLPAQTSPKTLLDEQAIAKSLSRIAHEIVEGNPDLDEVALVGIHTRGVPLAHRLRVAVVFGGRSSEHAISCVSAGSVLSYLHPDRFDVVPVSATAR